MYYASVLADSSCVTPPLDLYFAVPVTEIYIFVFSLLTLASKTAVSAQVLTNIV